MSQSWHLNICFTVHDLLSNECMIFFDSRVFVVLSFFVHIRVRGWGYGAKHHCNNISVISSRSSLLVEETGVPGENYRPVESNWQTLSHNVVSRTPNYPSGIRTHNVSGDRHWLNRHSNITSFFRFVNKRASYPFDIISLAHAPMNVTDFSIVSINCNPNNADRGRSIIRFA